MNRKVFPVILLLIFFSGGCAGTQDLPVQVIPESIVSEEPSKEESISLSAESSEEMTEVSEEALPVVSTITISFAGDCSLGNHHKQDYTNSFRREYDLQGAEYFMQNVAEIFAQDDMTLVNYEGAATLQTECNLSKAYNIKGDPEYVEILREGKIEAVSLANNHALDYGITGREDTIKALGEKGITYAYDEIKGIYEIKGIRIGFVSFSGVDSGLGKDMLAKVEAGLNGLEEQEADLKIVCLHWGIEGNNYPEEYQRTFAHNLIDKGADLIIGHHPHVLQGVEEYKGKMIVYSLGNFCFGANRSPKDKDTMIFQTTFTFCDGELQPQVKVKIIPCSISSVSERNNYQPTPATGEEAVRILGRINEFSQGFGCCFDEEGNYIIEEMVK